MGEQQGGTTAWFLGSTALVLGLGIAGFALVADSSEPPSTARLVFAGLLVLTGIGLRIEAAMRDRR
ncbi:hypothetical protein [Actinoplanes sp. NPDC051494]|uniref:hypothetical protein n=1 Tax=Actinoplanes sp. NPDC051494 TaxID=3363907 RepID=UPI003789FAD5